MKENAVITIISITIIVLNMMMIIVQVIKNVIMAGGTVAITAVTTVGVMATIMVDITAVTTMEGITMVTTVAVITADITAVVKNVIAAKDVTAAGAGFFNTGASKQQKELKKLSSFFVS
ncbi:hypothetical protein [Priestia megaterium]|uniref:hypothetical protein n=1 Tax=Priestia megaterium TaxID=1404 RepID=UPI0015E3AF5D|nr:hypothetical protein [Priestia megaterium]